MCKAGVQAYLTKGDQRKSLKEVIKRVSQGENLCRKRLSETKLSGIESNVPEDAHRLKPTEKAILTLFIQDYNLKEIAAKLSMTESAVGKTMAKLRLEFNVKSNAGLILLLHNGKLI